jgi:hypothetical protein
MSRNVSVYLPFWVAVPVWLFAAAVWAVILVVWGLVLIARAIAAGTVYLAHSGAEAIGERQAGQTAHARAGSRQAARQEAFTAGRQEFARQRAEQRQAHEIHVGVRREAARQLAAERKARRGTRPPLSWPGWGNIAAGVLFVTGVVLVGVAGSNTNSPLVAAGSLLVLASIVTWAVCVPVAVWRKVQARRRAAPPGNLRSR